MALFNFNRQINYIPLQIKDFLGVDFTNDPSEVAYQRSPSALNVVSSDNGVVEKRTGFEILHTFANAGKVHGIHKRLEYRNTISEDPTLNVLVYATYIHVGTQLWREQDGTYVRMEYYTPDIVSADHHTYRYVIMADEKSMFIETTSGFYIITSGQILIQYRAYITEIETFAPCFADLVTCRNFNSTYIPTTVIARAPTGGGTPYEAINSLQAKRKNSFIGDAATVAYLLDATALDAIVATDTYGLAGGGTVTAQILQVSGAYTTITEGAGLTVNRTTGVVTFSVAPGVTPITGQDNVIITFYKFNTQPIGYLSQAKIFAKFGMNGSDDYIFLGNCGAQTNYDYYGRASDMYFPDTGYTRFGSSQSAIMGYSRLGEYMVVHKDSEAEAKTIYLRSATLDANDEIIFPVKQGIAGTGAIAVRSFNVLRGDPIFLSNLGIAALTTNQITDTQAIQDRGYYINKRLLTEANLADAISIVHDNKYMLFINNHVYVCDSRHKYTEKNAVSESFQYEWYYWEGIDALSVFTYDGILYFGTSDGRLCQFRSRTEAQPYLDDDAPVVSSWTTPILFMGDITVKKSLKNIWLRFVQYDRSGVRIYYRADGITKFAKERSFDIFDFTDIDFTRMDFDTSSDPEVVVTNRVERQFMSIQFKMESIAAENLGLIELVAKYKFNSSYKG